MTRIDFHVNVNDRIGYACRLVRKVHSTRQSTALFASDRRLLEQIDAALWTFSATDFLPHCMVGDTAEADASIILTSGAEPPRRCTVLVNLDWSQPEYFSRFDRVLEVVGTDDEALGHARGRWKYYKDRGYELTRHDAGLSAQG